MAYDIDPRMFFGDTIADYVQKKIGVKIFRDDETGFEISSPA
jgi:hypothetical protein